MRKFWKLLLRKNLPPTILSGVNYAVFGLGDSGYVKYNVSNHAPHMQQQPVSEAHYIAQDPVCALYVLCFPPVCVKTGPDNPAPTGCCQEA